MAKQAVMVTGTRGTRGNMALINVPVAEDVREPLIFRLDMGKLSERHRVTLNRVWSALRDRHAELQGGAHVESVPDAVRWLLDQIADGVSD